MDFPLLALVAAFVAGILVNIVVYATGDPHESLQRIAVSGVSISVLAGFACGVFFVLTGVDGAPGIGGGLQAFLVTALSALVALPSFFIVFFAGEILHRFRAERSSRIIIPKFHRSTR